MKIEDIKDLDALIKYFNAGNPIKYLFFWGHRIRKGGTVGKQCFSQWFPSKFEIGGITYPSAEHYMMAEKARLFNDTETLQKILSTKSPAEAKQLGRRIKYFVQETWDNNCFDIVVAGNYAKFSQNRSFGEFLKSTGKRVIVEASPNDRIWGIGLTEDDPRAQNPILWEGSNFLGFALMVVRKKLSDSGLI